MPTNALNNIYEDCKKEKVVVSQPSLTTINLQIC